VRATPESLRVLARQGARWATAAAQDREPIIAMLHANYARAAIDHLRQLADDGEIREATGIDPLALERATTALQDRAMRALATRCPSARPRVPGVGLARTGFGGPGNAAPAGSKATRLRVWLANPKVGLPLALGLVYAIAANRRNDRREDATERTWRDFAINFAGSMAGTYAFLTLTSD